VKVLLVTMPDRTVWAVPVAVIAQNRAEHYAHEYEGTFEERIGQSLIEDTDPLFASDDYEIVDWAANNMRWEYVQSKAWQVSGAPPVDYEEGWSNGRKVVREIEP
jgi:hypothetical protein